MGYNLRAYTKKIIKLYDEIAEKLSEDEAGEFYLRREERGLLYAETATYDRYVHLMKQFDLCMTNFFINLKE